MSLTLNAHHSFILFIFIIFLYKQFYDFNLKLILKWNTTKKSKHWKTTEEKWSSWTDCQNPNYRMHSHLCMIKKHIETQTEMTVLLSLTHQQWAWQLLFVRDWNDARADRNMLARQQKEKSDVFSILSEFKSCGSVALVVLVLEVKPDENPPGKWLLHK